MKLRKGTLDIRRDLTHNVYEIDFDLHEKMDFIAGQFITIKIPNDDSFAPRSYSIASTSKDTTNITLCIKKIENGIGSNYLYDCKLGTTIEFMGPVGNFSLKESKEKNIYLLATGAGIVPFISMLDNLHDFKDKQFHLIFGVRSEKDIFYEDILNVYKKNYNNFDFTLCLSKPEENFSGYHGRITKKVEESKFEENSNFYICGSGEMVNDMKKILSEKGIESENIITEKYN